MEVDTIMRMGQATALVGIVMALQCVDRGLVSMDESVERLLPDLTSMEVLTGFDDGGKPIMRERNGIITLRWVLSNISWDNIYTCSSNPPNVCKLDTCSRTHRGCRTCLSTRSCESLWLGATPSIPYP